MACSPLLATPSPRPVIPDEGRIFALARLIAEIAEPTPEGPTPGATDLPAELRIALAAWTTRERREA